MQKMQNAKNAGFASLKQCSGRKLSTIDTAAQYNAAVVSI